MVCSGIFAVHLIISYTEDTVQLFMRNPIRHHLFAEDKQHYRPSKISKIDDIRYHLFTLA